MTLLWVYCSVSPYRKRLNGLIDLCFALVQCSLIPCISPRGCTGHFGGYLCSVDSQRPSDNPHYRQHKLEASWLEAAERGSWSNREWSLIGNGETTWRDGLGSSKQASALLSAGKLALLYELLLITQVKKPQNQRQLGVRSEIKNPRRKCELVLKMDQIIGTASTKRVGQKHLK